MYFLSKLGHFLAQVHIAIRRSGSIFPYLELLFPGHLSLMAPSSLFSGEIDPFKDSINFFVRLFPGFLLRSIALFPALAVFGNYIPGVFLGYGDWLALFIGGNIENPVA